MTRCTIRCATQGAFAVPRVLPHQASYRAVAVPRAAPSSAPCRDHPGAGDCFTATYAVAVLEGKAAPQALQFASAAASLCVQRKGAMPSLPSRAEVEDLLARQ